MVLEGDIDDRRLTRESLTTFCSPEKRSSGPRRTWRSSSSPYPTDLGGQGGREGVSEGGREGGKEGRQKRQVRGQPSTTKKRMKNLKNERKKERKKERKRIMRKRAKTS